MNNQQELRRALKSFYRARSLPTARVDFLLQAKNRTAQSARAWLTIPLAQIAVLTATIVIFLLVADHDEHQRAITEIVVRAGRLAEMDSGSVAGGGVFKLHPVFPVAF